MSTEATPTASEWLSSFAVALGVSVPGPEVVDEILDLAAVAAHASERKAAPVACWLAAGAGRSPAEALEVARELEEGPRD
ncbi:MAG TPA: DUF6457 domain-containing protein [Gemmatimonadota bacterium]|nr:DUF6457 domain-containing protein [Gemmatimonadota bacterium]